MIQLNKLDPMEVISRNLLIHQLSTINVDLVAQVAPELCIEIEHQVQETEGGEVKSVIKKIINWGYVLFQVNTPKLDFILSHFSRVGNVMSEARKKELAQEAEAVFNTLAGNSKPNTNENK